MPWIRACAVDELPDGEAMVVAAAIDVAVFNVGGEFFATQDVCTHGQSSLADGYIDGEIVECAFHMATFCIRDGRVRSLPATIDLLTFETKVEDGDVFVDVPDDTVAN